MTWVELVLVGALLVVVLLALITVPDDEELDDEEGLLDTRWPDDRDP